MFQRYLKDKKQLAYLIAVVLVAVMWVIILLNIIIWFFGNDSNQNLMDTIQTQEIVGVVESYETPTDKNEEVPVPTLPYIEADFTKLKQRNQDTVAWLKFDAVDISIPIVQTTDNEYYLEHDIDNKQNSLGWVFADARSNMEHLGVNTVFYGHNLSSKQMFGALKDIFNTEPDMKERNELIQLTTPTKQMIFHVTSVYVTDYEDWKYTYQIFTDDESKQDFIDRMREMNTLPIFDKTDLSVTDKFLTFSTCYGPVGTTKRLVVHARLFSERSV